MNFETERNHFRERIFELQKDYQAESEEVQQYQRQIHTVRKERREKKEQYQNQIDKLNEQVFFYEGQIH